MNATTRVNLHSHSTCSDGAFRPEQVAQHFADAGVVFAALTDHETLDGAAPFAAALRRRGIGSVSGVEVPALWHGEELHLLFYGVDPTHPELLGTLQALRQVRNATTQSVADSLRRLGTAPSNSSGFLDVTGPLQAAAAIALAHRAGGRAFLAHPLLYRADLERLRTLLTDLRDCGLDGVEAFYAPSPALTCEGVAALAGELGLLVSGGTDLHTAEDARVNGLGVDMPNAYWQAFRDALRLQAATSGARTAAAYSQARRVRRPFGLHVLFPALLAFVLFVTAIWAVLIPAFARALLDRKRETIGALVHAAWSMMEDAERQVTAGRLTRTEAQSEIRERISAMRYGRDNKDYFWLQDLHPRMIMHPYRPELNGEDLTDFRDPSGTRIFVEFADVVRRRHEGLVDYVWQWPGDPRRWEPKESYIKCFDPWGWIIGTGIYLDDVKHEIVRMERGLLEASLGIAALVALLLAYVVGHSRRIDRERFDAVEELQATTERYRSLVEAATEGTLVVLDGRCRYANPHLLSLLGYTAAELELLALSEVLPPGGANATAWQRIEAFSGAGEIDPGTVDGELRRSDGGRTACLLAFTRIAFGGRGGLVLLARETAPEPVLAAPKRTDAPALDDVTEQAPVGLFRARADRAATLLAANAIAARCLRAAAGEAALDGPATLAEAFNDAAAFDAFMARLLSDGTAEHRLTSTTTGSGSTTFVVRATRQRAATGAPAAIIGLVEDITSQVRRDQEREAIIERLQSSLLFLHEPIERLLKPGLFCSGSLPVRQAAALLVDSGGAAALVCDADGHVIGITTLHDLCLRVLAAGRDGGTPLRSVMSAPVTIVPGRTPVYECLRLMQESKVRHLGVTDDTGRVIGTLSDRDLVPFQQFGALVLTGEISRAAGVEEVVRVCRRTAATAKALLDSGAHPRAVVQLVSSVCDAATTRFVDLAIEELGPPPTRFAFLALGSQGRHEQTLVTDQDNAIIYAPPEPGATGSDPAAYFLELGRRVCSWLNDAGYLFCRGRFMAQNPVWTREIQAWKTHFSYWAARAEPEELLIFNVFFDFRATCGDGALIDDLRQHLFAELRATTTFFPNMARDALQFKPPVMLFSRILIGNVRDVPRGTIDLKAAMLPIVAFARLYALRHAVAQTNTIERLDALAEAGHLPPSSRDEIAASFTFLMRLRLRQQVQDFHAGRAPGNLINLRHLNTADRTLLRQAFAHIRVLQRRIDLDFLGGTHA